MQRTLAELLKLRRTEDKKGVTFILGEKEEEFLSYAALYEKAAGLLYGLQEQGFGSGDQVVFQLTDNRQFIYSFWACVLGKMIPVPVTAGSNDEHRLKLFKVWETLTAPRMIASARFMERLAQYAAANGQAERLEEMKTRTFYYEGTESSGQLGRILPSEPDDLTLIQFSSGSTGDPKGVMITHNNIFANILAGAKRMNMDEHDRCLNWMPLTHDMGLIGNHLKAIILNMNQYNIHTDLFIRRPSLWMEKASEHRITLLYSPNFGYQYFLQFFRRKNLVNKDLGWDLSTVRMFYNGAEPISLPLCEDFLTVLKPYGLSPDTIYPVYGLAEGTIAVTFPPCGTKLVRHVLDRRYLRPGDAVVEAETADEKYRLEFADEGYPVEDSYVRICDADGCDLGENKVGYIHISGKNVTAGYFNNKKATERVIDQDGWLNTEDLGFLKEGRLTVTGRAKDILFVHGQNYYAHDIERVAEQLPDIGMGEAVAVGASAADNSSDEILLFIRHKGGPTGFGRRALMIKEYIYEKMGIRVAHVLPVATVYKTTSGKVQRFKYREEYVRGTYDALKQEVIAQWDDFMEQREIIPPATDTEVSLSDIWRDIFALDQISVGDDFYLLGGDSLKAARMISRIREVFGVEIDHSRVFGNPTLRQQADFIDSRTEALPAGVQDRIAPAEQNNEDKPLSFAQQRIWFLDQLNGSSPQYNLCRGIRITGSLRVDILEECLNRLMDRHRILKTTFHETAGIPMQRYEKDLRLTVSRIAGIYDVGLSGRDELLRQAAEKPFRLTEGPLLRADLLEEGAGQYILLLSVHHIVFDGWSYGIFLKELMELYRSGLEEGGAADRRRVPARSGDDGGHALTRLQYADYTLWQRRRWQEGLYQEELAALRERLSAVSGTLELPYDQPRPALMTYHGRSLAVPVPAETASRLEAYAREVKATPFMVLLAAFAFLLSRYSKSRNFLIGSAAANRGRSETEEIIGFFTNNLVIRADIKPAFHFHELVRTMKKETLLAYQSQEIPFEKLVEEMNVPRDMSKNPLFQVFFSMLNMPVPELTFPGAEAEVFELPGAYARFDLAVDVQTLETGLSLTFEYNADLFAADTVARLSENYLCTLNRVLREPYVLLDEIHILSDAEEEMIKAVNWEAVRQYKEGESVVSLFMEQAARYPDKTAVRCQEEELTYGELARLSGEIAGLLRKKGIGREAIVGLYMERGVTLPAAILGIFRAGAAYMPMDPIFPRERLRFMIQDAGIDYILSDDGGEDLAGSGAAILRLPRQREAGEAHVAAASFAAALPEQEEGGGKASDLAYVLYTSGSTGKPKGVLIEQGALVNFLRSMAEILKITADDRLLAITTVSFDISLLELLLPLVTGGYVRIGMWEDAIDGKRLNTLVEKEDITYLQATPATWQLMLAAGLSRRAGLNILCGGEALPKSLGEALAARGKALYNMYGPTETTVWSTYKKYEGQVETVTIGKPLANTSVYVLDAGQMPVPAGTVGELYIGGAGLARGYLHQEELTADRFIIGAFPGTRLYRTGDLARLRPDLELECLGREDHQVKIRGFRIELEEIRNILSAHPAVKESVVAAKEDRHGNKFIAAYCLPAEGSGESRPAEIPESELRTFLRAKLPEYMVPSAFITMAAFPLTSNGKVDYKALPHPKTLRLAPETVAAGLTEPVATVPTDLTVPVATVPAGLIEPMATAGTAAGKDEAAVMAILTDIWKEALSRPQIRPTDNFFDLGGHSLLLSMVRNRIKEQLSRDVPMIRLFQYPTVKELAAYLVGMPAKEPGESREGASCPVSGHTGDIAVIGMSGRFPGSRDIDEFWMNLSGGIEGISHFDEQTALANGGDVEEVRKTEYVKAWGALTDVDRFDAEFFGYSPREATVLDPQQRIFLEEVWKAFEHAGVNPENGSVTIGLYAGVGMNSYMELLKQAGFWGTLSGDYQLMTGNDKDFLATRAAYKLNLTGPAVTVQTACSSSLVAVHQACASLRSGECDVAAAGGVSIRLPEKQGYLYQEGMILSPDGHCRAFDKNAAGTVGGNGAGVVILKRLEDAAADKDHILAVIRASAVNNDGSDKIGYTAPGVSGQCRVIVQAMKQAGLGTEQIAYVETHGTGTPLGDPIEIEGLKQAYQIIGGKDIADPKDIAGEKDIADPKNLPGQNPSCALGSVKTNIGHLDAAAGVAGLIKTILCIRHRRLVPSLHYHEANPEIDFTDSPFYINTENRELMVPEGALYMGVSSFGIGGTNAHLILSDAPPVSGTAIGEQAKTFRFPVWARNRQALAVKCRELRAYLEQHPETAPEDLAYTLQTGRKAMEEQYLFYASSREEIMEKLASFPAFGAEASAAPISVAKPLNGRKIPLPVYPLAGKSYWPAAGKQEDSKKTAVSRDFRDYLYAPVWEEAPEPAKQQEELGGTTEAVLLLYDTAPDEGFRVAGLIAALAEKNARVTVAAYGSSFKEKAPGEYELDLYDNKDYPLLLKAVMAVPVKSLTVVYLFYPPASDAAELPSGRNWETYENCYFALMGMAQAIGSLADRPPITIKAVTGGMHRILGNEVRRPETALYLGALKGIAVEYPDITCVSVDAVNDDPKDEESFALDLAAELLSGTREPEVAYRCRRRLAKRYKPVFFQEIGPGGIGIEPAGVYLFTGGLGGVGRHIAEELTRHGPVTLIFLKREPFPPEVQWEDEKFLETLDPQTSDTLKQLRKWKAVGCQILILAADVGNRQDMLGVREVIRNRFGKLTGILHAAGSSGGGMLQGRRKEDVRKVFHAKVKGTFLLYQLFLPEQPRFMLLFSSLNAVTGGFGQSDYSGANAWLDAFAQAYDGSGGIRMLSIGWERWPGVGMAGERKAGLLAPGHPYPHPLLGVQIPAEEGRFLFSRIFDGEQDWVLSEHQVYGTPTAAGTVFLEMARAAYEQISGQARCFLKDVAFLTPLSIPVSGEDGRKMPRRTVTILKETASGYDFLIASQPVSAGTIAGSAAAEGWNGTEGTEHAPLTEEWDSTEWTEHARGRIGELAEAEQDKIRNHQPFPSRESDAEVYPETWDQAALMEMNKNEFIYFGDRWKSLLCLHSGSRTAWGEIRLDQRFGAELEKLPLHPALLDVATGALRMINGGNYLPFSYGSLSIEAPLTAALHSRLEFRGSMAGTPDFISADITLYDQEGSCLVMIHDFSMRLVAAADQLPKAAASRTVSQELAGLIGRTAGSNNILTEGLTPAEGQRIFTHLLRFSHLPFVAVSRLEIQDAIRQADYRLPAKMMTKAAIQKMHERPELSNAYAPPRTAREAMIRDIWQPLLGITGIGIHDEFFALGGDSLLLLQLHVSLKEASGQDFSAVDLYQYNTIALQARLLDKEAAETRPAFGQVNQRAKEQQRRQQQRRSQLRQTHKPRT